MSRSRLVGETFSPLESALLDILCSGTGTASSIARAQRAEASWGGYEIDDCECFLISAPPAPTAPTIDHDGGPFAFAEVSEGSEGLGLFELWVVDGRLHSVNYMPFGDDHDALPSPEKLTIELVEDE